MVVAISNSFYVALDPILPNREKVHDDTHPARVFFLGQFGEVEAFLTPNEADIGMNNI